MKKSISKKVLYTSLGVIGLLLAITEPATHFLHGGMFVVYEPILLEPIFFSFIALAVSSAILLSSTEETSRLWWKKFMVWFAPLAVIVIASGTDGSGYVWLPRTDLSVIVGSVLVVITLIFALVQRFYYKVK
ncbi:hypothetical protein KC573_03980 [candidate division WWE3 bacterium]|uniref:Uncharacterized protein n=1 Tax=candidate division WWE3 bacterium TaxID=2053526 RepID=A0A955LWM7_UNCKA|nr:hypothetical protein [candidate division WWE3 bacterium]